MSNGTKTRTRLVDSLIRITCLLENNAFSVLHYVMVALHYSMLHRFEIFSAPGTIVHGSISLPPHSLASSQGCSLAIEATLLTLLLKKLRALHALEDLDALFKNFFTFVCKNFPKKLWTYILNI